MKKFLMISTVLAAGFANSAQSQNYDAQKGSDHLMQDTRRMEPERSTYVAPARQPVTTTAETPVTPVQREEPEIAEEPEKENDFDNFTGFYAGADAGYTLGSYGDVDLDGFEPGVFAGYGFEYDLGDWLGSYVAMEIAYYWGFADDDNAGISYEKKNNLAVTLRPGITVSDDALGYGIVGYSRGTFEGNGDEEHLSGYILGAGAQYNTGTALKPRIEYTYTNYGDEELAGSKFEGHENNIKVGFLFQF